jgi:hypothetical protein
MPEPVEHSQIPVDSEYAQEPADGSPIPGEGQPTMRQPWSGPPVVIRPPTPVEEPVFPEGGGGIEVEPGEGIEVPPIIEIP